MGVHTDVETGMGVDTGELCTEVKVLTEVGIEVGIGVDTEVDIEVDTEVVMVDTTVVNTDLVGAEIVTCY